MLGDRRNSARRTAFFGLCMVLVFPSVGFDCMPAGNAELLSLEIEMHDANRLAFDSAVLVYDVGVPTGAATATVRARSMDVGATVLWSLWDATELIRRDSLGVGGGTVVVDVPLEGRSLQLRVVAPEGAYETYVVSFSACDTDCSDSNDCTADVCNPADGSCSNPDEVDGVACDSSGVPGACMAGACEADPIDPIPAIEMACPEITISVPPPSLGLDPFYAKYVDVGGIPLISSSEVSDDALRNAFHVASHTLNGRPCIRAALIQSGVRIGVIGSTELTTDMPEYADLYQAFPGTDWNVRARALGSSQARPLVSNAEENFLRLGSDRWAGQNIFVHEFAHAFFNQGVDEQASGLAYRNRLQLAYLDALNTGVIENTYAATNMDEYWAVGIQNFFDTNLESSPPDGVYNEVDTRVELLATDPALHDLIAELLVDEGFTAYCDPSLPREDPVSLVPVDPYACDLRTDRLVPVNCAAEPSLTTEDTTEATTIQIVNRTYEPYTLYWLDEQGVRRLYGSILARTEGTPIPTTLTQPWVVTSGGACVAIYLPTERRGRAYLPLGTY